MPDDRTAHVAALLSQAEAAHGVYEATELNGVYDEDWPRWYAQFAVDNDIATLLGRAVTADEVAQSLARSWDEFERSGSKAAGEPWAGYTANWLAEEFSA